MDHRFSERGYGNVSFISAAGQSGDRGTAGKLVAAAAFCVGIVGNSRRNARRGGRDTVWEVVRPADPRVQPVDLGHSGILGRHAAFDRLRSLVWMVPDRDERTDRCRGVRSVSGGADLTFCASGADVESDRNREYYVAHERKK